MQRKNLNFIHRKNFELIENLPINGTKFLLIFDDSCEETSNYKVFVKISTAGRHGSKSNIHQTQFDSSKQIGKRRRVEATELPLKLVTNKNTKAKGRETWIPFKI